MFINLVRSLVYSFLQVCLHPSILLLLIGLWVGWNEFKLQLKELISFCNPSLILLIETKVQPEKNKEIYWSIYGFPQQYLQNICGDKFYNLPNIKEQPLLITGD